jgi:PilZ domain.
MEINEIILLVKIHDVNNNYLGKGYLEKIEDKTMYIKGANLPKLAIGTNITINVFNELEGVTIYECKVQLGAQMQLTANILKENPTVERRASLKVKTDITLIPSFIRRGDQLLTPSSTVKIKVINLSVGGLGFTSTTEFLVGDVLTIVFNYYRDLPVTLTAKIIRQDIE